MARLLVKAFAAAAVAGLVSCAQPATAPAGGDTGGGGDGTMWTVTFVPDGGEPAPEPQSVINRGYAKKPAITRGNDKLKGWFLNAEDPNSEFNFSKDPITGATTLYAVWQHVDGNWDISDLLDWNNALAKINEAGNGAEGAPKTYALNIKHAFMLPGKTVEPTFGVKDIKVLIEGAGGVTISLSQPGYFLNLMGDQAVEIKNLEVKGLTANTVPLISVPGRARVTLGQGARVTGNTNTILNGGGVLVSGGALVMEQDAAVSGNAVSGTGIHGGGVALSSGSLDMGGTAAVSGNASGQYGGGIYALDGATLVLDGEATVSANTSAGSGGGVYVSGENSSFTMKGASSVSKNDASNNNSNTVSGSGGGVFVADKATFTMEGNAVIGGADASFGNKVSNKNLATALGGGLYATREAVVQLKGGAISYNQNAYRGGGFAFDAGATATMGEGFTLSNNLCTQDGGTGHINGATFVMEGGTAYGRDDKVRAANFGGGFYITGGARAEFKGGTLSNYNPSAIFASGLTTIIVSGDTAITGNVSGANGGAFIIGGGVQLTLKDTATISGNTAANSAGGAVYLSGQAVVQPANVPTRFIMEGGTLEGNTATGNQGGGAVYVQSNAEFVMKGGAIQDNTAPTGGGVTQSGNGVFRVTDGIIYGADASESLKNKVTTEANTAALLGVVEWGTFTEADPPVWEKTDVSGNPLTNSDNTVKFENGQKVDYREEPAPPPEETPPPQQDP